MPKEMKTILEVCDILGISRPTLYADLHGSKLMSKPAKTLIGPSGRPVMGLDDEDVEVLKAYREKKIEKAKSSRTGKRYTLAEAKAKLKGDKWTSN